MTLSRSHLDARGIVIETPEMLRDQIAAAISRAVTRDAAALARMLASEVDWGHPETAPVRAHIALNDLADLNRRRDFGWTVEDLITYSSMPAHRGHFGLQRWGRRYASDKDPAADALAVAEKAIADRVAGIDLAAGGVKFVDKNAMGGVQAGTPAFAELCAKWATEGLKPHRLDGFPSDFYVFRRG